MNKSNKNTLKEINQLLSLYGWGLRRSTSSKIIVTNADGSGAVLNKDDRNNSIAETMFYRMMDDLLQNSGL